MKQMTFEGYWAKANKEPQLLHDFALETWNCARQGMIHEDEAIRIPSVDEWSENCTRLVLIERNGFNYIKDVAEVKRPTPQWTPKVGETVFAYTGYVIWVAVVVRIDDEKIYALCSIGTETEWSLDELKPFDPKYIGRNEWEAIPRP